MKIVHFIAIAPIVIVLSVIAVWAYQDAAASQKAKDDYAAYQESITPKVLGRSCKEISALITHCTVKMDYGKQFGHPALPYYNAETDSLLSAQAASNDNHLVVTSDSGNTTVIIKFVQLPSYYQSNNEAMNIGARLAHDMHGLIFEDIGKASYDGLGTGGDNIYTVVLHSPLRYDNINIPSMLNFTQKYYDSMMEKEWTRHELDVTVKVNGDSSITLQGITYLSEVAEMNAANAAANARAQWCDDHTYQGVVGGRDAYLAPRSCYP